MKKCLIGFIVTLMILICPLLNVNASEYDDGTHVFINNEWVEFTDKDLSNYQWLTSNHDSTTYRLALFDISTSSVTVGSLPSNALIYNYDINNKTWTYKGTIGQGYGIFIDTVNAMDTVATTVDIYKSGELYLSAGTGISVMVKNYLDSSLTKANDLNGVEFYNVRFNAANYNSGYKYLIKTSQETEWTDITELLNNEAYQYDYSLYYNTTLYMQVLDAENNILESKTHTINDLEEFGFKFTITDANDLKDRFINVVKIDATNCYIDGYVYRYTYGIGNNKIYYNLDITSENRIIYLNHAIYNSIYFEIVTPDGNTVIHEQEINQAEFLDLKKYIGVNKNTSYFSEQKVIEIDIDFSQFENFEDIYNFEYFQYKLENDTITEMILADSFTINSDNFNYYKSVYFDVVLDNSVIATVDLIDYIYGDFDTIYNETLEEEMMNDLEEQDYSTVSGMVEGVKNFISATGEFITTFFELIMYFFNKLNIWIRTCIIALFVELVIFKTIKAVRK